MGWRSGLALGAAAVVSAALAQTPRTLTRESGFWVQNAVGSLSAENAVRLRVTTAGNVVVRGGASKQVVYTLKRRIRARSAAEAAALARACEVVGSNRSGLVQIAVRFPVSGTESADLSITVPRALRQAWIESLGGNVQAFDIDGDVETRTAAGKIQVDRVEESVARTGGGDITLGKIAGPVKCYSGGGNIRVERAGGESVIQTAGGEVFVHEVLGPIHISTGGGNIKIGRSAAAVFAHTEGGLIQIDQAAGIVSAENSAGTIQVNAASGGVQCQSSGGAIHLHNVNGTLRAATTAGSIVAELLAGHKMEDSLLRTDTGDITVFIPSNVAVRVVARNESAGSGRIISDFPEIRMQTVSAMGPALAEGVLNGGGPVLQLNVSAGTIYVRRLKQ